MRSSLIAIAIVVGAAFLPACHHGSAVSNDPSAPIYRNSTVDLSQFSALKVHFVSVTTNNNEGVDLVKQAFMDNIKSHFSTRFKTVAEGDAAAAGEAIMDVDLTVNWGSRAARVFVGMGAGKAGIIIKYNLKDSSGNLVAKLDRTDSMSGGFYGGDSKALVFAAAEKWDTYFVNTVLATTPPPQ